MTQIFMNYDNSLVIFKEVDNFKGPWYKCDNYPIYMSTWKLTCYSAAYQKDRRVKSAIQSIVHNKVGTVLPKDLI